MRRASLINLICCCCYGNWI